MSTDCRSTVTYRSNLQPVNGSCLNDTDFLKTIRDPFALYTLNELLKNIAAVIVCLSYSRRNITKLPAIVLTPLKMIIPWDCTAERWYRNSSM